MPTKKQTKPAPKEALVKTGTPPQNAVMTNVLAVVSAKPIKEEYIGLIKKTFSEISVAISPLIEEAKKIVVKDESDIENMERARELGKAVQKIRINAENLRKTVKADAQILVTGVDTAGRYLRETCENLEDDLDKKANFAEYAKRDRLKKCYHERAEILRVYVRHVFDPAVIMNLDDTTWDMYLKGVIQQEADFKAKDEADKKAAKEKEDERLRLLKENEELQKKTEKLENKIEEIKVEKREEKKQERVFNSLPDNEKLEALADQIQRLVFPFVESKEAKKILEGTRGLLEKTATYIRANVKLVPVQK